MEFFSNTQIIGQGFGPLLWQSSLLNSEYPIPDFSSLGDFGKSIAYGLRSGQTIDVLQKIEIEVEVLDERKIDRDFRYFVPRDFIGSWIVLNNSGIVVGSQSQFLFSRGRNILENWHRFTVLSDKIPSEYIQLQRQQRLDLFGCNWELDPTITSSGLTGFILANTEPDKPNGIALSQDTFHWENEEGGQYPYGEIGIPGGYQSFTQVEGFWYEMGFYFYEGCQPISIRESLSIPALQQIVLPPIKSNQVSLAPQCIGIDPTTCNNLFEEFINILAEQSNSVSDFPYLDQATCQEATQSTCQEIEWICPIDGTIYTYYLLELD